MKQPTPKQYAFLGMVAGVSFVIAFGLGSILNVSTGIPLVGGLVNGVLVSMLLTIGFRTVGRFPSATILWTVFGLLAIPTATLGTPGAYKVIPAIIAGLIWDIAVVISKGRKWGYLVGGLLGAVAVMLGVFEAAVILGFPAAEKLRPVLYFLVPVNAALALLGIWLGLIVWERRLSAISLFRAYGDA